MELKIEISGDMLEVLFIAVTKEECEKIKEMEEVQDIGDFIFDDDWLPNLPMKMASWYDSREAIGAIYNMEDLRFEVYLDGKEVPFDASKIKVINRQVDTDGLIQRDNERCEDYQKYDSIFRVIGSEEGGLSITFNNIESFDPEKIVLFTKTYNKNLVSKPMIFDLEYDGKVCDEFGDSSSTPNYPQVDLVKLK